MAQDARRLGTLHEEGALPGAQAVVGAEAGEDAVGGGQGGRRGRHIAAHLPVPYICEQRNSCNGSLIWLTIHHLDICRWGLWFIERPLNCLKLGNYDTSESGDIPFLPFDDPATFVWRVRPEQAKIYAGHRLFCAPRAIKVLKVALWCGFTVASAASMWQATCKDHFYEGGYL